MENKDDPREIVPPLLTVSDLYIHFFHSSPRSGDQMLAVAADNVAVRVPEPVRIIRVGA